MRIFEVDGLGEGTRCWKGYEKKGMKTMFGKRVPNCVKKEDIDPEGPEVTIGDYTTTHFFMCGSAIKTAEKHTDKPGMERLIRLQDMIYKLEQSRLRPTDLPVLVGDASKAKEKLGWNAQIPLNRTILEMIHYHLKMMD